MPAIWMAVSLFVILSVRRDVRCMPSYLSPESAPVPNDADQDHACRQQLKRACHRGEFIALSILPHNVASRMKLASRSMHQTSCPARPLIPSPWN